jgi:hypothetical protein
VNAAARRAQSEARGRDRADAPNVLSFYARVTIVSVTVVSHRSTAVYRAREEYTNRFSTQEAFYCPVRRVQDAGETRCRGTRARGGRRMGQLPRGGWYDELCTRSIR